MILLVHLVAGGLPRAEPAVEQPHVRDAGIHQDQGGARCGDLPGVLPRPLFARLALGITAI
jgi:hypothetical protein